MNSIDISTYITDDTNLIEIYFCLYKYNHENAININLKMNDENVEKYCIDDVLLIGFFNTGSFRKILSRLLALIYLRLNEKFI